MPRSGLPVYPARFFDRAATNRAATTRALRRPTALWPEVRSVNRPPAARSAADEEDEAGDQEEGEDQAAEAGGVDAREQGHAGQDAGEGGEGVGGGQRQGL